MNKRYVNIKELSEYIGIKKNTIYSWVNMGKIPYIKLGGLVRFDMHEIENWINRNKVQNNLL